jgi:nitroreductase
MGAAMCLEHLLCVARELGLGASSTTGPLLAEDRLGEIFEVPAPWRLAALVPVGYPRE